MFFEAFILTGCSPAVVVTPVSTPYKAKSVTNQNLSNVTESVSVSTPYNAEAILAQTIQLKPSNYTIINRGFKRFWLFIYKNLLCW